MRRTTTRTRVAITLTRVARGTGPRADQGMRVIRKGRHNPPAPWHQHAPRPHVRGAHIRAAGHGGRPRGPHISSAFWTAAHRPGSAACSEAEQYAPRGAPDVYRWLCPAIWFTPTLRWSRPVVWYVRVRHCWSPIAPSQVTFAIAALGGNVPSRDAPELVESMDGGLVQLAFASVVFRASRALVGGYARASLSQAGFAAPQRQGCAAPQ